MLHGIKPSAAVGAPGFDIMAVTGAPGVESVADMLTALLNAGRLENTRHEIMEGLALHGRDGMSNCHHIALALLVDLHNAGKTGWRLLWGGYSGHTPHSWLENGRIAVDGSPIHPTTGRGILLVQEYKGYRKSSGSRPLRAYTPADVLSGRYEREMEERGEIEEGAA